MNHLPRPSNLLAILLLAVSVGVTVLIGLDVLHVRQASDEQLLAQMRGAAYEDIFGFGYWPTVAFAFLVQLSVVAGCWFLVRRSPWRFVALASLLAFIVVAAVEHSAHQRQVRLWSSLRS